MLLKLDIAGSRKSKKQKENRD